MALEILGAKPISSKTDIKSQFGNRLRLIRDKVPGITRVDKPLLGYTLYTIFTPVLVIRAYNSYYTLHTNGDLEHYEVKRQSYSDVKFECTDLQFIANLLEIKE